jgi:hypothetical protein
MEDTPANLAGKAMAATENKSRARKMRGREDDALGHEGFQLYFSLYAAARLPVRGIPSNLLLLLAR